MGDELICVLVTVVEVVEVEEEGRENGKGVILETSFIRLVGEGAWLDAVEVWFGEKGT